MYTVTVYVADYLKIHERDKGGVDDGGTSYPPGFVYTKYKLETESKRCLVYLPSPVTFSHNLTFVVHLNDREIFFPTQKTRFKSIPRKNSPFNADNKIRRGSRDGSLSRWCSE